MDYNQLIIVTRKLNKNYNRINNFIFSFNLKNFCLLLIFLWGICSSLYYIIEIYKSVGFSSDSAVRMHYAREALETNSYFPRSWNYVNRDIWNFDQTLIARVVLPYLPISYVANAIINIISLFLFYCSVIVLIKKVATDLTGLLQSLALISTGISFPIANQLFGEMAYGFFTIYFIVILAATWTIFTTKNASKRSGSIIVLTFIATALAWINPIRAAVYLVAPLLITLWIFYFYDIAKFKSCLRRKKSLCVLIILIFVVTIVGYWLHFMASEIIQPPTGYGTTLSLTNYTEYPKKLLSIMRGFLSLVGGEFGFGLSRKSITGLYQSLRLFTGILFLILILIQVIRGLSSDNAALKFIILFSCSSLLILCAVRIGINELQNDRYLMPPFIILLIALATQPLPEFKTGLIRLIVFGVLLVQFSTSLAICSKEIWQQYEKNAARSVGFPLYGNLDQTIEYLMDSKHSYGYATYWRAGIITALSQERVKVRQIDINDGIVAPARWHSSNRWYEENYYFGPSFLLLTPEEYASIDWTKMLALGLMPVSIEKKFDYIVLNYAVNIARVWQKKK